MTISDEFKKVLKKETPEVSFLVPMVIWFSGYEPNIDVIQQINKKIYNVKHTVLIKQLVLNNICKHFIKYPPKAKTEDKKLDFFYNDICKFFGWTRRELRMNLQILNLGELKKTIAKNFAYDTKERKAIDLDKLEGIGKNVRDKSVS